MIAALLSLLLGVATDSGTAQFEFVDTFGPSKQTAPRYRALTFGQSPPRPLADAPPPGPGAHFALARVGPGAASSISVVWQPEAATGPVLWVDGDNDHRLSEAERHLFAEKTIEIPATIRVDGAGLRRTIVFKRGAGSKLYLAVRGHTRGSLQIGDKTFEAALTDGDADGCFDKAGADYTWIDLNGDRAFDSLTEQFPLGTPVAIAERTVLFQANPEGTKVTFGVRGADKGRVRLSLPLQSSATVHELRACLVSEFGELCVLSALREPIELPIGKYRVDALTFTAVDEKGRAWSYGFSGQRQFEFEVKTNQETDADLLSGLLLRTGIEATTAAPGSHITVAPMWQSAAGTFITDCKLNGASTGADISLTDASGKTLERSVSGFA